MSYHRNHRNWLKPAAREGTPIADDIIVASIFIHVSLLVFLHSDLRMRVIRSIFQLSKMTGAIPSARTAATSATKKRAASPEVTVVDDVQEQPKASDAKKPRLSTTTDDGPVSSPKAPAVTGTKTISSKSAAPSKKLAAPTVKKAIFMPGCKSSHSFLVSSHKPDIPSVGPKTTEPTIPATLRANLSVPLASTASALEPSSSADTATIKKEFIDALPEDLKQLLDMEIETMGDDWFVALRGEFVKPYFREVGRLCLLDRRSSD
jgi:hypothetical protein